MYKLRWNWKGACDAVIYNTNIFVLHPSSLAQLLKPLESSQVWRALKMSFIMLISGVEG